MTTDETYRTVMTVDPPAAETALECATRDFLFGQVWNRPGLSVRERRIVTLACVAAADSPRPIDEQVYAALRSGDVTIEQMNEITLHFAVYCGWPKASHLEGVVRTQWARIHAERGETAPTFPTRSLDDLGPESHEERIRGGVEEFVDVNLVPAPPADSPYFHAGIRAFVFGHVWRRPGLTRRDRRLVTIPCVGVSDAPIPILSHVGSALGSGDLTYDEVQEVILQVGAYSGFAKAEALHAAASQWRASQG